MTLGSAASRASFLRRAREKRLERSSNSTTSDSLMVLRGCQGGRGGETGGKGERGGEGRRGGGRRQRKSNRGNAGRDEKRGRARERVSREKSSVAIVLSRNCPLSILQSATAAAAHCVRRRQRAGWIGEEGARRYSRSELDSRDRLAGLAAAATIVVSQIEDKRTEKKASFQSFPNTHRMTSVSSS